MRLVNFASRSQVTLVHSPTKDEIEAKWYSKKQKEHLKRSFASSVGKMAIKRATTPIKEFLLEELYEFIGMESRWTLQVLEMTQQTKRTHVRTIIAAQARQRVLGEYDPDELVRLSQKSSRCARDRAQKSARYWFSLRDDNDIA